MNPCAFNEDMINDPYAGQLAHLRMSGLITGDEQQELLDPSMRYEDS